MTIHQEKGVYWLGDYTSDRYRKFRFSQTLLGGLLAKCERAFTKLTAARTVHVKNLKPFDTRYGDSTGPIERVERPLTPEWFTNPSFTSQTTNPMLDWRCTAGRADQTDSKL